MDLLNTRINRRTLGGITAGVAATSGLAYLASAQDATPEADVVEEAGVATLAALEDARQVNIVANNNSYSVYVGDANMPGWFVFNVENASDSDAAFNLARLPEDVAVGEFTTALWQITSGNVEELPEWLADVTFAGGTYVPVGGSNSALVNLEAGEWIMFSNLPTSTQSVTTFKVLGEEESEAMGVEPVATPEGGIVAPEGFGSTFTVSVGDGSISADSAPQAGLNIVGVRNDASSAANFVVLHSTEAVDSAAGADVAASYLAGEETGATLVGGMGALSPDAYGYVELTAETGSYVAFSSMVDTTDGSSQLEGGAVIVFDVG